MKIDGHFDPDADIAWLRFEGYGPERAHGEEVDFGLRKTDPETGEIIALEYRKASETLPEEFLRMLPQPPVGVPG
ncbi:MAG: hypothetical protein FJW90_06455 [Actinobacteria bacterium]|nr:hypothetical protein [Actinomycetota bacterium]